MATRTPLFPGSGGNLEQMSATEITNIVNQAAALYLASPSVTLARSATNGTTNFLANMNDTRYISGAASRNTTGVWPAVTTYPTEATTAEPSLLTIAWRRISQARGTQTLPVDTSSVRYPLYYIDTGGNNFSLRAMNEQDFYDTFISPAINIVIGTTYSKYKINTTTTLTDYTSLGSIFVDTQANTAGMTAAEIGLAGTTQTDATTNATYYLMQRSGNYGAPASYTPPAIVTTAGNVDQPTAAEFNAILLANMKYAMTNRTIGKVTYSIATTGTALGTAIVNKAMTTGGTGNYTTYAATADDYRAQEFPNGTVGTINTWRLVASKA